MEFGALIPLWYMTMCCFVVTPLAGLAALAFIRFSLRDIALSKYILATVFLVCLIWFLFPFGQLLYAAIQICRHCPDSTFLPTREILASTFTYAAGLVLIPGTASGFILAFLIVVPTTILVRKSRKKKEDEAAIGDTSNGKKPND